MRYVVARFEEYQREMTYRSYVTKSLQLIPQNKYMTSSYIDLIDSKPVNVKSGDEIVADIMQKAGLHFGDQ